MKYQYFPKRVIDIVGAIFLLILFLPLSLLISILIKIDSVGPVFADVPERIGEKGKKFKMYKFRSMINNAHFLLRTDPRFKKLFDEYKRSSYKLLNDPRVTKIGKFIRCHSIDEIPQLFNVLKGEMSIVGPRAYYPDELENQLSKYPHTKKLVTQVLSVKPGVTGLWQVTGRSEINFDKRITIDADYVKNMSLWNDLKIMLLTPIIMISGRGAV
ncbi:exopolysaccharide biosynthesis protein [Candidatus Roizmanbacteria bacterium CG_4_8_14_3_um_filter_34_9]|uniref:Exopolysaccharide biosynthesis protein n=2 Tax=Candidatus Roizmaniibacteriota TaxID=1752723 RepID=A0A2M6YUU1_9BACT|nr:MAG: exopolysaccharide biosynthesis protein [Candidatus Roizmanbacteria bacterium CG07_land_8_20_14_0_80_34_15]PIW73620.1 MAG: exopolysaccharide biosynthesis protein [Candidatus Roizmanbacteria bacterium CG_4_8_14_3_um_filter_34_9]